VTGQRRRMVPGGIVVDDPEWYRRAVIYELSVRAFYDANGDGVGDLAGVVAKLDYLEWLGVDCLWLLPFYPSPLRDGGYDVTDFTDVHPDLGTLDDLAALLDAAHGRNMRVLADLVLNHTSDQHPWFVESRSSRDNPRADWYVWSDDDRRWPQARVVFVDAERSNWTYEPRRGQFYWHRFYSHQPDLNYDNPAVVEEMLGVVRFWLTFGFDGFRLDAVPYLYQRDGTACESVPETHALLRRIRREVDRFAPRRVLLAEANQPPETLAAYFGEGDECHMAFHFPLMPKLFAAVRHGRAEDLAKVVSTTAQVPPGCQWALFLRNHDELSLEQVDEQERQFLLREYAKDPRARRHLGIGRRLGPLVEGDRAVAEALVALLLALPGSPVLYYGDELLMGDDLHLPDRDPVRTPMQWSAGPHAGFSPPQAPAPSPPPVDDPVFGYRARNVEADRHDPRSFLRWLQAVLALRRAHDAFAVGSFELVDMQSAAVLAFVRRAERDAVLCVHNLSGSPLCVTVDPSAHRARVRGVLAGAGRLPMQEGPSCLLELGAYQYAWLELDEDAGVEAADGVFRGIVDGVCSGVPYRVSSGASSSVSTAGRVGFSSGATGHVLDREFDRVFDRVVDGGFDHVDDGELCSASDRALHGLSDAREGLSDAREERCASGS
jgi:maltose alpha-D-glucosyltransferase/alpha-amylase